MLPPLQHSAKARYLVIPVVCADAHRYQSTEGQHGLQSRNKFAPCATLSHHRKKPKDGCQGGRPRWISSPQDFTAQPATCQHETMQETSLSLFNAPPISDMFNALSQGFRAGDEGPFAGPWPRNPAAWRRQHKKYRRHESKASQAERVLAKMNGLAPAQILAYLRKIDPYVFEELALCILERQGIAVVRNASYSGDGGLEFPPLLEERRSGLVTLRLHFEAGANTALFLGVNDRATPLHFVS